jgi:hypothetical protein
MGASMVGLTGYWLADDGCQYYLSQEGAQVWWAGLDNHGWLHDGLQVSNVFVGWIPQRAHLPGHAVVDDTLEGEWFDVPRGPAMSSGRVTLRIILDANREATTLVRQQASGGFKPTQLRKSDRGVGGWSGFWFDKPNHHMDAEQFFQMVVRNNGNPLLDDLKPFRNVVVVYGWLRYDDPAKGFRRPFTSQHADWGEGLPDFFDSDHNGDRDANFDLSLDQLAFHNHLQRSDVGWIPGRDPRTIYGKLRWCREHQGQGEERIHCEMVMYGVTSEDNVYIHLYPGWADSQGNSILVNGRPVNGALEIGGPAIAPGGDPGERYLVGLGGHTLPPDGSYVRVTGVLALDCGHLEWFPLEGSACYEDPDDEKDMSHDNVEIHPVFGVDLINATPTANLSGTWAAENGDTIYLHQVGETVAGLRLPPLGAGNAVTVLHGIRQGDAIRGAWRRLSPPITGGELLLQVGDLAMEADAPDEGTWRKLYDAVDQTPTMTIAQVAYRPDDVRHDLQGREGGTATFTVTTANFRADAQLTYSWTVPGVHVTGTHEQSITVTSLPAAGTVITVSVMVEDDAASRYEASLDFVVLPPLPPDERMWCELMRVLLRLGKLARPGPVPMPNLPDPVPVEVTERIRDRRAPTLTEISGHLRVAEHLVQRLTQESQSE